MVMRQLQFSEENGRFLQARGLQLLESNHEDWLEHMRDIARQLSVRHGEVTTDDLRRYADERNLHPASPNAWGNVLRGADWVAIGRRTSRVASNHARKITVYRWAGRAV